MVGLETIYLLFRHAQYLPHRECRHPSSLSRTVLPALTYFGLEAPRGYSEYLMARLDTPRLDKVTPHYSYSPFDEEDIDYPISLGPQHD